MYPIKSSLKAGLALFLAVLCAWPAWANSAASSVPAAPSQTSSVSTPLMPGQDALRVEVQNVQGEVSAAEGAVLRAGDTIKTGNGSCRLLIDGKTKVLVSPNTVLKITEAMRDARAKTESTFLTLDSGNLKVELPKLKKGSSFAVTTPTAVATVRGTTLYIQTGTTNGHKSTTLYVDETRGGVNFKNIFSGESFLVPAFSLSHSLANGQLDKPVELTDEQKEAFFEAWKQLFGSSGVAQQFGIEEIGLIPPGVDPSAFTGPELPEFNDAFLDQLAEQNVVGQNIFNPLPGLTGGPTTPKEPGEEEEPEGPTEEELLLEQQERAMIRAEIADLLGDQDFDNADANLAQVSDAQTGKVFTDVHGNRVRVDQYIFQNDFTVQPPDEDPISISQVGVLALTARTGSYQNGVSSAQFVVNFNRVIGENDGPLRGLPWDDYMRVVEDTDFSGVEFSQPYEQFIVHENAGLTEPDLYPTSFGAVFTHPTLAPGPNVVNGLVAFAEAYNVPEQVESDQGTFWVQGLTYESMSVIQSNGESLLSFSTIANPAPQGMINGTLVTYADRSVSQTDGLPDDANLDLLMTASGVNAFRNSAVHPAMFEQFFGADRIVLGLFIPIDDAGNVIDAPGFQLNGLRDVLNPNPLVNGGNYNLELIFAVGTGTANTFSESFRVDVLIDNDIFNGGQGSVSGIRNPYNAMNTSLVFPASLEDEQNV